MFHTRAGLSIAPSSLHVSCQRCGQVVIPKLLSAVQPTADLWYRLRNNATLGSAPLPVMLLLMQSILSADCPQGQVGPRARPQALVGSAHQPRRAIARTVSHDSEAQADAACRSNNLNVATRQATGDTRRNMANDPTLVLQASNQLHTSQCLPEPAERTQTRAELMSSGAYSRHGFAGKSKRSTQWCGITNGITT